MKAVYIYLALFLSFLLNIMWVGLEIRVTVTNGTNPSPHPSEYVQSRNIILGNISMWTIS